MSIFTPRIEILRTLEEPIVLDIYGDKYGFFSEIDDEDKFTILNRIGINKVIHALDTYLSKSKEVITETTTDTSLQIDSPSHLDLLNRKPFVAQIYTYITKLWADPENTNAFTILIDGKWGTGKSTVLGFLQKAMEEDEKPWTVIHFNAWQNHHLELPWWVFLNTVSEGVRRSRSWFHRARLWIMEKAWRSWNIYRSRWGLLVIFIAILVISYLFGFRLFNIPDLLNDQNFEEGDIIKVVTGSIGLIGAISTFLFNIIQKATTSSESDVSHFRKHGTDPMQKVKNHYGSIVRRAKKPVTVFIDDIDRCKPEFVVQFMEGLQTLFKDEKVLYIIAGDHDWIRLSFEQCYSDLQGVSKLPGQSLGAFFSEKLIQQTVQLPEPSEDIKKEYLRYLLLGERTEQNEEKTDLSDETKDKLEAASTLEEIENVVKETAGPYEKKAARTAAAEKIGSETIQKEIKHKLMDYAEYIGTNPRNIKLLINNLSLGLSLGIIAGYEGDEYHDTLFRWYILKTFYPDVANTYRGATDDKGKAITPENAVESYAKPGLKGILEGLDRDKLLQYGLL
ncbi:MAG: P-loop NTPase fold protein [Cyclobacteriaceae bacterium]